MRGRNSRGGNQGSAKLDRAALRRLIQAEIPMTTALGVVRKFPGEDSHFEIQIDENGNREILVDVELIPRSEKVLCRLGFGHDSIYKIPRINQEVAVLIPFERNSLIQDELEFDPVIVAILDQQTPEQLDDDDIVVIQTPRVLILADSIQLGEDASEIAKLSDVETLRDELLDPSNHQHIYVNAGTPTLTTSSLSFALSAPEGTTITTAG